MIQPIEYSKLKTILLLIQNSNIYDWDNLQKKNDLFF